MSRIGKKPVAIPAGVTASMANGVITMKGPKGELTMSTVPDMLPEEYVEELSELQSNAPPMGWLFVRRRMAAELGADWQSRFLFFEREAAAAASLVCTKSCARGACLSASASSALLLFEL